MHLFRKRILRLDQKHTTLATDYLLNRRIIIETLSECPFFFHAFMCNAVFVFMLHARACCETITITMCNMACLRMERRNSIDALVGI